jgi:hypothetical protein
LARTILASAALVSFLPAFATTDARAGDSRDKDVLFVRDLNDNTVKGFEARSGVSLGAIVTAGRGGLKGPIGILPGRDDDLLVINQKRG